MWALDDWTEANYQGNTIHGIKIEIIREKIQLLLLSVVMFLVSETKNEALSSHRKLFAQAPRLMIICQLHLDLFHYPNKWVTTQALSFPDVRSAKGMSILDLNLEHFLYSEIIGQPFFWLEIVEFDDVMFKSVVTPLGSIRTGKWFQLDSLDRLQIQTGW